MIAIVTGPRQVGKTRWLERLMDAADASGLRCVGLVSPGRWKRRADGTLEKVGIDALLLPERTKIPYATRRDLTEEDSGSFSQADEAKLAWRVYDDAIERINAHFDTLYVPGLGSQDLLIVDEIGTLELVHGKGFTSALRLLDNPAEAARDSNSMPNAVIIMRPELLETTKKRLTPAWGEPLVIEITESDSYLGIESLIRAFNSESERS